MKNKSLIAVFAACAALVSTVSCKSDFLNVDYYTLVNPEGVYEDADNVFKGLIGVYNSLYTSDAYYIKPHPALANFPALDMQADGWDAEIANHSWGVESKSDFFGQAWRYSYKQVSRANLYLADLANVSTDVIPESKKLIYESEARCIRGAAYYYLTINFSRVPMLMTGETYANAPDKARPESNDAAWAAIKEDFEFAAEHLDWTPDEGMIGRFTKAGALAYAAKANMYMGDFATAKKQLEQIISGSGKKLNPCQGMISWVDNMDSEETIWEVSFPKFKSMGWDVWSFQKNNDSRYFSMQTKAHEFGGWGDSMISYEYVRCFEPGDKRLMYNVIGWDGHAGKGGVNPFTGDQIGTHTGYDAWFMDSYEGMPNNHCLKWWKSNDVYTAHSVQLYRFSEVLLNYAECCFETNDAANGWKAIAQIRNRAWGNLEVGHNPNECGSYLEFPVSLLNTATVEVPDAEAYYTKYAKKEVGAYLGQSWESQGVPVWKVALMQERRKEFIMEYNFWYDLCRMGLVEAWLNCEYPKNDDASFYNTKTGKYYVAGEGNSLNKPWNDASPEERENMIPVTHRKWDWAPHHLVYPIPTSELTANKLCEQNEGY